MKVNLKRQAGAFWLSVMAVISMMPHLMATAAVSGSGRPSMATPSNAASVSDAEKSFETAVFTDAGPFLPPAQVSRPVSQPDALWEKRGLILDQTVEEDPQKPGEYRVRLEAYAASPVTDLAEAFPVDIVLVLDQSDSMACDFEGNFPEADEERKQYGVKGIVHKFIETVGEKYNTAGFDHRIAIMTFDSRASVVKGWTFVDEAGKEDLQSAVDELPDAPSGARDIGEGMAAAADLLENGYDYGGGNLLRQKAVIVVADGVPTKNRDFDAQIAADALRSAEGLKDSGATIYSVGIFNGADPFSDIQAANGFLNDLSTNSQVGEHYYLTADHWDALDEIFTKIGENISAADGDLDEETVVDEVLSPCFELADETEISVKTADYTGGGSFGREEISELAAISGECEDGRQHVAVKGFYFGPMAEEPVRGKKLIVEFNIRPREGFLGGDGVPVSSEESGVYIQKDGEPQLVERFEAAEVDVPIPDITVEAAEKNAYLMGVLTDEDYRDGAVIRCGGVPIYGQGVEDLEEWQHEYIRLPRSSDLEVDRPPGDLVNDTVYTLSCTIGSQKSGQSAPAKVQVYKPRITLGDSHVFRGEELPEAYDVNANIRQVSWEHQGAAKTDSTAMSGSEPEFSWICEYDPSKVMDGKVSARGEIGVKVIGVAVKSQEAKAPESLIEHVTLVHEGCENARGDEMEDYPDDHFLLHIRTGSLTVKSILEDSGSSEKLLTFTIKKDGVPYTSCAVPGNGEITISELPLGNYEICQETGKGTLGWRLGAPEYSVKQAELTQENTDILFTCTNRGVNRKWLSGIFKAANKMMGGGQ